VQARKRELLSGLLEGHVGGVVRAGEEVRARACQPLHAHGQGGPDRAVVSFVPRGHAARQGDAVQGHVRVVIGAQPAESLLAERSEAQRGPFRAVRENAKVPHAHRSRGPGTSSTSTLSNRAPSSRAPSSRAAGERLRRPMWWRVSRAPCGGADHGGSRNSLDLTDRGWNDSLDTRAKCPARTWRESRAVPPART
jgi:hypothetical protein